MMKSGSGLRAVLRKFFNINPDTQQVFVYDAEAYSYDDEVIKKAEAIGEPGFVSINAKDDSFIFIVETTGAFKASQLIFNAIDVLKHKIETVRLSPKIEEDDAQFIDLEKHMRGGGGR